jgi:hypothetical protein
MSTPNARQVDWTAIANASFALLDKMLLPAKLELSRGTRFRIGEYFDKKFHGREAERPTDPTKVAPILYEAVVKDVNDEVNGGQRGQLTWTVLPKRLAAHYRNIGKEKIHHEYEPISQKQKRVSPEAQREAKEQIEQLCVRAGLHELTSRAVTIHKFVQEQIESGADLSKAIPTIKKILAEPDLKRAVQILNEFRAGGTFDYSGGSFYSGQGFRSGGAR